MSVSPTVLNYVLSVSDWLSKFRTWLLLCGASFTTCYSLEMPINIQEAWAHRYRLNQLNQLEKQMCVPLKLA